MNNLKTILEEIKEIIETDYAELKDEDWNGQVSLSGIKRYIYGLWNNGCNEYGDDMLMHMSPNAELRYRIMINKYVKTPKIRVFL